MAYLSSDFLAVLILVAAIVHTFSIGLFQRLALKFPEGSIGENIFHLLGEVEIVFGIWATMYLLAFSILNGSGSGIEYLESLNFAEPIFVFVVVVTCSTKPILSMVSQILLLLSSAMPNQRSVSLFVITLTVGPLLGSLITEPATMTVTALMLLRHFFHRNMSSTFMYATLGTLFVNVSIGGTLTPYAAPPILMVASKWNWDFSYMLINFGWKGALAIAVSTLLLTFRFKNELLAIPLQPETISNNAPFWVTACHLLFLTAIIYHAHHTAVFVGIFLLFLGLVTVTKEYQDDLNLKNGLLIAFFLGGLVVLAGPQKWWIEAILEGLDSVYLYFGSMGLTALIDNAALTYLGSQVPSLSGSGKYFLVAGSVVGGGLTLMANAPNLVGYSILNHCFGKIGIRPARLLISALIPTAIAAICFGLL